MRRLEFSDMSFSRSSAAWCPITGNVVANNTPRVVEDLILENLLEPVIYYRFTASQGFTAYDTNGYTVVGNTTHYLVDLQDDLESNTSAVRSTIGTSFEGRDIDAFRLGPVDRKHFLVTNVIHGNETDGLTGSFKAIEILMTHPDFAVLRANYTIFYIPCCNPDGHYNNTRMLSDQGPHPDGTTKGINLNRVWPWFWTEYVPSSSESKGATVLDSAEATALYNWKTTGNGGGDVPVAFVLDQHSTVGDGSRYQSRDKCYREYEDQDWLSIWADWLIFKDLRSVQGKRIREDNMPDLWVNYYRSRFRPHWHSWLGTLTAANNGGIPIVSMVSEHNKVAYIEVETDPETYASACNYNMDYVISCARIMQGDAVTQRNAVLVEHEVGDNQAQNSDFEQWQEKNVDADPEDYRPGYWTPRRSAIVEYSRDSKHMDYHGKTFSLAADVVIELPATQNVGPENYHDIQLSLDGSSKGIIVSNVNAAGSAVSEWDQDTNTGELTELFQDALLPNDNQKRLIGAQLAKVVLLDMGNTGLDMKVISYSSSGSYARSLETTYTDPRIGAAVAFDGSNIGYAIGGYDDVANVRTVLAVNRTTYGISEIGTNLMPTADTNAEAVYCSGGNLDGMIVVIGGDTTVASQLRVTTLDVSAPSASEVLLTVTGTTLPSSLIGHGLYYDGVDTIWIYGGEDPSTNEAHRGVWTITWSGSVWSITEETLIGGLGDDPDPVDYSGTGDWADLWSRWRYAMLIAEGEGTKKVVLLGGVKEDPDTLLKEAGPYLGIYIHDITDSVIHRPQDYTFGYLRYNTAFSTGGAYDKVNVSWSIKAKDDAESAYTRITNSPGDSVQSILTTRRSRTYYMHPPKWWFRHHGSLDLSKGRPDRDEDEWRLYMRSYRDSENVLLDSPMVQVDTLWPSSWSPYGYTRQTEEASWSSAVDPRWLRLKLVWLPSSSFLAMTSDTCLARIDDGTRKLELWAIAGDRKERCYYRPAIYGPAEPQLQLRAYDDIGGYDSCDMSVYWGGYVKDVSIDRFDSSLVIEIWQHPDHGRGFLVNNAGSVGKSSILGSFDKGDWAATASVEFLAGGWWAEPDVLTIDDVWVKANKAVDVTGALIMGDRDPSYGRVDPKSPFRYIETFIRGDDSNLGTYWDIIKQTGNGWNIVSNAANCVELGWERWDAQPLLRDTTIWGDVRVNHNGGRVGFFTRLAWDLLADDLAHAYLGSLYVDGAGNATIEIELLDSRTGSQLRSTLDTTSISYNLGDTVTLKFETNDTTLTVTAYDDEGTLIDTCTTTDSVIDAPDAFGICGETLNGSSTVEIDYVQSAPGSAFDINITD